MTRLIACLVEVLLVTSVAVADHRKGHDSRSERDVYAKAGATGTVKARSRVERRRLKRKLAARRTPKAKRRRAASRDKFKNLSTRRAIRVARAEFPWLIAAEPYRGARLRGSERIKTHLDDYTALVDSDDGPRDILVESTLPLVTPGDDGEKARVDLTLEPRGTGFAPVNPLVRLTLSKDPRRGAFLPDTGIRVYPAEADAGGDTTVVEEKLFYGNVAADTDLLVMAMPTGLETFSQLRSADSPEDQSLSFELPAGARLEWTKPDGAPPGFGYYEIARGKERLATVNRPSAFDADGMQVPVETSVEGDTMRIVVKHRDGDFRYPIMLDPHITESFDSWRYNNFIDFTGWKENSNSWPWAWNKGHGYTGDYGLHVWSSFDGTEWYDVGDWGEWYWDAPGTAFISRADFGYVRHDNVEGQAPYWFWDCIDEGIWGNNAGYTHPNGPGWDYSPRVECGPVYHYNWFTACLEGCNDTVGSPGNRMTIKVRIDYGGRWQTQASYLYMGGAAMWVGDRDAPTVSQQSHSWDLSKWMGPQAGSDSISIRAADSGLGVKTLSFPLKGITLTAPVDLNGPPNAYCSGARQFPCPATWRPAPNDGWTRPFGYGYDDLNHGVNTVTAESTDPLGNTGQTSWQVKVDKLGPSINASGSLKAAANQRITDGRYGLHVEAADGGGGDPQSGIKSLEVRVDGRQVASQSLASCPNGSCALTLPDWTFVAERYAEGEHTIDVIAKDQVGHASVDSWTVKVAHAASADLGPGSVNLKTGGFSVTAQDASIDATGQGLAVSRTYNSRDVAGGADGPFGPGWVASLPVAGPGSEFVSLADQATSAGNTVDLTTADGANIAFARTSSGGYVSPPGYEDLKLKRNDSVGSKVAQWRLGDLTGTQARDSVGPHHGSYVTPTGGAYTLGEPGAAPDGDTAVALNGADVVVPSAAFEHARNGSFSVELWYTPPNPTELVPLFTADTGDASTRGDFYLFATASGQVQLGYFNEDMYTPAGVLTPGVKAHVVATYDAAADVSKIYVNGVEQASSDIGPLAGTASMLPKIGGWIRTPSWADFYGKGVYDEVATYSRALSGAEVGQLAAGSNVSFELTDSDGNTTVFERGTGANTYLAKRVRQAATNTTSTFEYDSQQRLVRATAPAPAGVDCSALVRGCRALSFTYASTTTAGGGALGDFADRLSRVDLTAWDPSSEVMTTTAVAQYLYDSNGRLREAWDPRISPALKTAYSYDGDGHMTSLIPPGQAGWSIAYAVIDGDPDTGRVRSVSRAALPGTATTVVAYKVPLSGAGAPYAMGSSSVAAWGQTNAPAEATAIFPPDQVPTNPPASYTPATVHYLDGDGREVNVATPGGRISTSEYESHDKVRRRLTAANRQRAIDAGASSAARSRELDTQYTYNFDGTELQEELSPAHATELGGGQVVEARKYTRTTYDEGAPGGGPYHLPTTLRVGARAGGAYHDERTTKLGYDGQGNLGWTLRKPTSETVDPSGLNLKTVTLYDAASGKVTETRMPSNPNGGDASASQTIYYSADDNEAWPDCGGRPEFAALPCRTRRASQEGVPEELMNLPVTTKTYNRLNQVTTESEVAGGAFRTTTTDYDLAGRLTGTSIAASEGSDVPATTTTYNASNGLPASVSATDTDGVTRTISRAYDTLGRVTSYTDGDGVTSTTTYDLLGRVATTSDGKGTQTRSYDASTGLLTQLSDSHAGSFSATYDGDGQLATQDLPNGLRQRNTYDETGQLTRITYDKVTNCSSNCTWLDYTGTKSIHDQWVTNTGSQTSRRYTYDAAGRLAETRDTPTGEGCTVRFYAFDADSNRTSKTTYPAGFGGECQVDSDGESQAHSYDAADRQIDAGILYDGLGRQTALPESHAGGSALALNYYADDQTHSVSQGDVQNVYAYDPLRRQRQRQNIGGSGETMTFHYSDDSDSPSWTAETADGMRWSRNIAGVDGDLAATYDSNAGAKLQLRNLHGDVVAEASLSQTATGPLATYRTDEFGSPQGAAAPRYGYLGSEERRTELDSGVIQMGVRTYVPAVGRFTATDPIAGGSANAYDYASADPVNNVDLDGRKCRVYLDWVLAVADNDDKYGFDAGSGKGRFIWGRIKVSKGCERTKITIFTSQELDKPGNWSRRGLSGYFTQGVHLGPRLWIPDCADDETTGRWRTDVRKGGDHRRKGKLIKGRRITHLCDGKGL